MMPPTWLMLSWIVDVTTLTHGGPEERLHRVWQEWVRDLHVKHSSEAIF